MPTQKPEEEAVKLKEWAETKITWFYRSTAEVEVHMVGMFL